MAAAQGVARRPRRVALVGAMVAGVATQYENVSAAARAGSDLEIVPVPVRPYAPGALERWLAFAPSSMRGTIRSIGATAPLYRVRPDMVWTQIDLPLLPWLMTVNARGSVPVIYTADSTPALLRSFGALYGHWGGRSRWKARMRDGLHAAVLGRARVVNAWSEWAARSMRDDYGVDPARLKVLPPGVDTAFWKPRPRAAGGRPRILFVGGDFARKGGDALVDVWRSRLRGRAELDVVTRPGAVAEEPGLRVHTGIEPNDPRLLELYQAADLVAIPTRADCFSMAGLEAMATGLPVVTCPVGGVSELFTDGRQGIFVAVDDRRDLAAALEALLDSAPARERMGRAARLLAMSRYDARRNADRLLSMVATAGGER